MIATSLEADNQSMAPALIPEVAHPRTHSAASTIGIVVIVLTIIQVAFAIFFFNDKGIVKGFTGSESYSDIARYWAENGQYSLDGVRPTAYRPPAYPALLATTMRAVGTHWQTAALSLQVAMAIACGLLLFILIDRLFLNRVAAIVSVCLYVADIPFQLEAISKRETVLFATLILGFFSILALRRTVVSPNQPEVRLGLLRALVLGIIAGLAYLTRPAGLILILISPVIIFLECRARFSLAAARLVSFTIGSALFVAPWQYWVHQNFHTLSFWPTSTSGLNLYQGNNPTTDTIYPHIDVDKYLPWIDIKLASAGIDKNDELKADKFLRNQATAFILAEPLTFLKRGAIKAVAMFSPMPVPLGKGRIVEANGAIALSNFEIASGRGTILTTLHGTIVLIGCCLFIFQTLKRTNRGLGQPPPPAQRHITGYVIAFIALVTLMHVLTFAETRFRLPLDPFLILFASLAYSSLLRKKSTHPAHG